jgi:hypothetical protein
MKLAIRAVLLTAAALSFALIGAASAIDAEQVLGFAGNQIGTLDGVGKGAVPNVDVTSVVYDNTASPAIYAVSSTDLAAIWGDRMLTTGTGVLNAFTMSIFNSGSSAGPLLTAQVQVLFYDAVTSGFLGGFNGNINFGAGLNPGFYSLATFSNLDVLAINLGVTDIVVTQTITSFTGTGNRFGIASLDPVTVGSSATSMYIQASTVNGGTPGFYTFGNGPANPGYQIVVTVQTVGVESGTWSGVKELFR